MLREKYIKIIAKKTRDAKIHRKAMQLIEGIFANKFFPKLKKEILDRSRGGKITPLIVEKAYVALEKASANELRIANVSARNEWPGWNSRMSTEFGQNKLAEGAGHRLQAVCALWVIEVVRKASLFVYNAKRVVIQEKDVAAVWLVCDKYNSRTNIPSKMISSPVKRKRGRPRKVQQPKQREPKHVILHPAARRRRGRGRPRKVQQPKQREPKHVTLHPAARKRRGRGRGRGRGGGRGRGEELTASTVTEQPPGHEGTPELELSTVEQPPPRGNKFPLQRGKRHELTPELELSTPQRAPPRGNKIPFSSPIGTSKVHSKATSKVRAPLRKLDHPARADSY